MVAMVDPFESGMEFPFKVPGNALAEDLRDFVGGQFIEAKFTGAFEEFVDGEGFAKDEVQTIFNLAESVEPAKIHSLPFSLGELRAQKKGPIIETFLQPFRGESIRSFL